MSENELVNAESEQRANLAQPGVAASTVGVGVSAAGVAGVGQPVEDWSTANQSIDDQLTTGQPVDDQQEDDEPIIYATKIKSAPSTKKTFLVAFAGALLACVVALGGYTLIQKIMQPSVSIGSAPTMFSEDRGSTTISVEGEDVTLAEAVAQKALPSVVAIDVYTKESATNMLYGYGFGFGYGNNNNNNSGTLTQSSLGSGVVLSSDGYIITNYHVVEGSDALKVTIEGAEYDAELVGYDSSSDIAVIKAKDASGLTPIEIADSDALRIGQWVMTIGSPFGLEQSVATGVVSATSRSQVMASDTGGETTVYANLIQTDAAINPGNSGGALVNKNGELIGINTLITSYSGNYSGVGFAIPSNYAISLAEKLMKGETPTHAVIGVSLSSVTPQVAQRYDLKVDAGAYIVSVSSGSGAEKAGLQAGDIIVSFNGKTVESASDVMIDVRTCNPGDMATIQINRDGSTKEVKVELGESGGTAEAATESQQNQSQSPLNQFFNRR